MNEEGKVGREIRKGTFMRRKKKMMGILHFVTCRQINPPELLANIK
jgi:hypothetical protein